MMQATEDRPGLDASDCVDGGAKLASLSQGIDAFETVLPVTVRRRRILDRLGLFPGAAHKPIVAMGHLDIQKCQH
jgi:hypothetical protein